jgi:cytoskeletal protein CcmA (bactofilin family)
MTMFTRNDKMPDPLPRMAATNGAGDRPEQPVVAEIKRPVAVAQPLSPITAPRDVGVSVISRALKITGQLESTENIQIDGEVDGDVRGVNVKVGSNAKVRGSVYGDEVEVAGSVDGKIEARKVVLTSSAHMSGDVIHQDISIQSGAFIHGLCRPEFGKTEIKQTVTAKPKDTIVRVDRPAVQSEHG